MSSEWKQPCSLVLIAVLSLVAITSSSTGAEGLKPWADNPWYWSHHGIPVLLLGASDDDNLFQWCDTELIDQLDRLAACGGNVVRCTMSDRQDRGNEVYAFHQLPSGKYDLRSWNEEYWQRFARLLAESRRRDIFVQVEIFDRFDYSDHAAQHWQSHPYHPKNNVNYGFKESGFSNIYPEHPSKNKQPFFFTTPQQSHNHIVLQFQQRFVRRLLEVAAPFGNVLYCIDNETKAEEEWARYWTKFIKEYTSTSGTRVMVTEMWDDWDLRAERHRQTLDHPELYDYVDISQNTHNSGQKNRRNLRYLRDCLSTNPRPMNTTKVYGADDNKFGDTHQQAIDRFWSHLLGGAASIRFHRPPSGLGLSNPACASLRAARLLETRIKMWQVEPADHLVRADAANPAYVAATEGVAYALFVPCTMEVSLDLRNATGAWRVEWIDLSKGEMLSKSSIMGGAWVDLEPPFAGPAVAALTPMTLSE